MEDDGMTSWFDYYGGMAVGTLIATIAYFGFRHVARAYRTRRTRYYQIWNLGRRRETHAAAALHELEMAGLKSAEWNGEKRQWDVEEN